MQADADPRAERDNPDLLRADIDTIQATAKSLMPEGLEARMPHEKTIGKPYAGNPHVRFERGPQETEPERHRA